jgi:uncharacterized protein (TIGR04255 family)
MYRCSEGGRVLDIMQPKQLSSFLRRDRRGRDMTEDARRLPSFKNPPVSETYASIELAPLAKFGIPYFGLYWQKIRRAYPEFQVHPPIASQIELFGDEAWRNEPTVQLELSGMPRVRCWFLTEDCTRIIQVQHNRFACNWRRVSEAQEYPRYKVALRQHLEREWKRFDEFLEIEELGDPQVLQMEIGYVNDLEFQRDWNSYADLKTLIAFWSGSASDTFLPPPESIEENIAYPVAGQQSRLRVSFQHLKRSRDRKQVMQVRLMVRGKPADTSLSGLLNWLDTGHEWIVRSFASITSPRAHELWGRTDQ